MMHAAHKERLRKEAVLLTNELDVTEEFLSYLAADRVISNSNIEELMVLILYYLIKSLLLYVSVVLKNGDA